VIAGAIFLASLLVHAGGTSAVKLPANLRIEARIAGTLTAPTSQPMHMPTDVAADGKGRIFVADGSNDRVLRFNGERRFELAISSAGAENFSQPVGLAVDDRDRLWVADTGHHRLVVLNSDGKLVERIDLPAAENGEPVDPTDIAITPDFARTCIVDNDHHRLLVRDNASRTFTSLGRFGRAIGQFQWPFMIGIAPDGYVYVTEAIGARVQRLRCGTGVRSAELAASPPVDHRPEADATWAGQVGQWGVEAGRLYRPKGVVVDVKNRVYVSDSTLGVVQVFDSHGGLIGVLTSGQEGEPLRFQHPMGMCFDRAGRLYVVDLAADRVAVVELPGGWLPTTQPIGEVVPP